MTHYLGESVEDIEEVSDRIHSQYKTFRTIIGRETIDGAEFSTGRLTEGVTGGETTSLLLENPSDSGKHLVVFTRFTTAGKFYGHKTVNPTVNDTGTEIDVVQRRSNTDREALSNAYHSPTVDESTGDKFNRKLIGSGDGGAASISGSSLDTPEVIIAPGHSLYVEATNTTTKEYDCVIEIDFVEVPSQLIAKLE